MGIVLEINGTPVAELNPAVPRAAAEWAAAKPADDATFSTVMPPSARVRWNDGGTYTWARAVDPDSPFAAVVRRKLPGRAAEEGIARGHDAARTLVQFRLWSLLWN